MDLNDAERYAVAALFTLALHSTHVSAAWTDAAQSVTVPGSSCCRPLQQGLLPYRSSEDQLSEQAVVYYIIVIQPV